MVADDDPLRERLVHRHGEPTPQLGLADEQQAEAVLGVHRVVGQEAQILEDVVAQVMRLVDDEHAVGSARLG